MKLTEGYLINSASHAMIGVTKFASKWMNWFCSSARLLFPAQFNQSSCKTAPRARDLKQLAFQRHNLNSIIQDVCKNSLSLSLLCANRLPFSNNGWDLWEPARNQNSLAYGCTFYHTRSKLNSLNQKPVETRSASNRRCTFWLQFFRSASRFCSPLTAPDKRKLFPLTTLQIKNQNEL